jgi:rod shape-determining protein MreB and related proteins
MFGRDISIDLGTANVVIHVKGRGIVLNEPSAVAVDTKSGDVLAVGTDAYRMAGRTPEHIVTVRPLRNGVIADFEKAEFMMRVFLDRIQIKSMFGRPRVIVCCPAGCGKVEQKAVREAVEKAGVRRIFLEEEPKAAAVGAGMDIYEPAGHMIVDIGGGTTDAAVLSMGTIVSSACIETAGDHIDQAVAGYMKKEHQLLIGSTTAEEIKKTCGTVSPEGREAGMTVRGRDMVSGLPRSVTVSAEEMREVLLKPLEKIIQGVTAVLEKTPPELAGDVMDRGIMLSGGGACLHGIGAFFSDRLDLPVYTAEKPLLSAAEGAAIMLEQMDQLAKAK